MKNIVLRQIDFSRDLPTLFHIMTDPKEQAFISHRFTINNIMEFEGWLINRFKTYYHEFYIIENHNRQFVGFTYSHEYFSVDGHVKFTLYILPQFQDVGYGAIASIKFMDFLYKHYAIRKIFITIFDYNARSLRINLHAGFIEEGCLKDYRFLDGKYHDLHYLSISREKFYESFSMMLKKISPLGN